MATDEQRNAHAVYLGADADGDGWVTDVEWSQLKPFYDNIKSLMQRQSLSWEEALAHNERALSQEPGVDADGDGFVSNQEWSNRPSLIAPTVSEPDLGQGDPTGGYVVPEWGSDGYETGGSGGGNGEVGTGGGVPVEQQPGGVGNDGPAILPDGEVVSETGWIEGSGVNWGGVYIPPDLADTVQKFIQTIPTNTPELVQQAAQLGIIPDTPELHAWLEASGITTTEPPKHESGTVVDINDTTKWTNAAGESITPDGFTQGEWDWQDDVLSEEDFEALSDDEQGPYKPIQIYDADGRLQTVYVPDEGYDPLIDPLGESTLVTDPITGEQYEVWDDPETAGDYFEGVDIDTGELQDLLGGDEYLDDPYWQEVKDFWDIYNEEVASADPNAGGGGFGGWLGENLGSVGVQIGNVIIPVGVLGAAAEGLFGEGGAWNPNPTQGGTQQPGTDGNGNPVVVVPDPDEDDPDPDAPTDPIVENTNLDTGGPVSGPVYDPNNPPQPDDILDQNDPEPDTGDGDVDTGVVIDPGDMLDDDVTDPPPMPDPEPGPGNTPEPPPLSDNGEWSWDDTMGDWVWDQFPDPDPTPGPDDGGGGNTGGDSNPSGPITDTPPAEDDPPGLPPIVVTPEPEPEPEPEPDPEPEPQPEPEPPPINDDDPTPEPDPTDPPIIIDPGGGNDDNDDPVSDEEDPVSGPGDWLGDILSTGTNNISTNLGGILEGGINMYASDKMGEAYEKASEDALAWQRELQEWQRPFWEHGKGALPGLTDAINNQLTPDARVGSPNLNTDPDWIEGATSLYGLNVEPNVRSGMTDPQAFQGYQNLQDFAGQGGNWNYGQITRPGTRQAAPSGPTLTDPTNAPVAGPSQAGFGAGQPSEWDILTGDAIRMAENRSKARGRLNSQEARDSAFKSYVRAMGDIEGLNQSRLAQELQRRAYDRDTAMGTRQQQAAEQGSAAQMAFDQLTRNRERAFSELFAEDQAKFDRKLAGNEQRMDVRRQYFGEKAAEDEAQFARKMAEHQQKMQDRA